MRAGTAEVLKLRGELESRFGRAILPAGAPRQERGWGFRSGVGALDRLLPGGVPRGALTLWTGEVTAGRTAALRALVVRACAAGARVAVVDAGRTLDATFACTAEGPVRGVWVVRPPDEAAVASAAWAAEALLRAGAFDLVVLDGCVPAAVEAQRLRALARERDAALLVTTGARERSEREPRASAVPLAPGARRPAPGASLQFGPDVRVDFRRAETGRGWGLRRGGRFRRPMRLSLERTTSGAPANGGRGVELAYEPADRLRTGPPPPDRSPGGR